MILVVVGVLRTFFVFGLILFLIRFTNFTFWYLSRRWFLSSRRRKNYHKNKEKKGFNDSFTSIFSLKRAYVFILKKKPPFFQYLLLKIVLFILRSQFSSPLFLRLNNYKTFDKPYVTICDPSDFVSIIFLIATKRLSRYYKIRFIFRIVILILGCLSSAIVQLIFKEVVDYFVERPSFFIKHGFFHYCHIVYLGRLIKSRILSAGFLLNKLLQRSQRYYL